MSGRISAIDAVNTDPNIIYVGAATGGLWKSTSGGVTWTPLTDSLPAVRCLGGWRRDSGRK